MGGCATHDLGDGDTAAHAEITARSRFRRSATKSLPCFHLHGRPERKAGAKIGPAQGDHRVRFEFERRTHESHLDGCGVFRIADQEIASAERESVSRARGGNTEMRPAEASQVLHSGLQTRRYDADRAHRSASGTKRTRSPMRSRGGGTACGSEEAQAGPANKPPSSRRGEVGRRRPAAHRSPRSPRARVCGAPKGVG